MKTIIYTLSLLSLFFLGFARKENNPVSKASIRNQVQRIYTTELGVKEKTGRNDGRRVEEYLRQVGLKRGDPWCAAFICWVFDQAGVKNPHTGWSPGLFPKEKVIWQRKIGFQLSEKLLKDSHVPLPQRGDVFGIWFPEKQRIAHAGFVDQWSGTWLITVEGNSNEAGSREGDGVYRKRRLVKSVSQVSNFIDHRD